LAIAASQVSLEMLTQTNAANDCQDYPVKNDLFPCFQKVVSLFSPTLPFEKEKIFFAALLNLHISPRPASCVGVAPSPYRSESVPAIVL